MQAIYATSVVTYHADSVDTERFVVHRMSDLARGLPFGELRNFRCNGPGYEPPNGRQAKDALRHHVRAKVS